MVLKRDMFRDLAKTLTFAVLHFGVGFTVSYAFTGSIAIAGGIALVEPAVNTFVFYWHERAWKNAERQRVRGQAHGHDHAGLIKAVKQIRTHNPIPHAA
jgi:uncharacterized membrane protein